MALQGYGSASGWGGMNDAYLEELPQYEYGKTDYGKDFTYGSAPLSGGEGDSSGVNTSALNYLGNPFPGSLPKRDFKTRPENTAPFPGIMSTPNYTPETMLDTMKQTVYDPTSKAFIPVTDNSYPGYKYFPERMEMIDNLAMFGSTEPGNFSQDALTNIANNAGDVQASVMQLTHDNPGASVEDIFATHHQNFTGFDSAGNFVGNADNPIGGGNNQNVMGGGNQWDTGWSGESGAAGGAGDFFMNKGGQVAGGK